MSSELIITYILVFMIGFKTLQSLSEPQPLQTLQKVLEIFSLQNFKSSMVYIPHIMQNCK